MIGVTNIRGRSWITIFGYDFLVEISFLYHHEAIVFKMDFCFLMQTGNTCWTSLAITCMCVYVSINVRMGCSAFTHRHILLHHFITAGKNFQSDSRHNLKKKQIISDSRAKPIIIVYMSLRLTLSICTLN